MKPTIVIASGYFDPIHVGHIEYLKKASELSTNGLIVIVNNDRQVALKKGKPFMKEEERLTIVRAIYWVCEARLSIDTDRTVIESIRSIHKEYQRVFGTIPKLIFAKGGDRFSGEIPEAAVCKELGIDIVDGLGEKIQSSSALIANSNV